MGIIALCALAIVLPALTALFAPRHWRRAVHLLVPLLAGFAIRLSDGPQVFDCGGEICLDDALLATALAGSAALVVVILLVRWFIERRTAGR